MFRCSVFLLAAGIAGCQVQPAQAPPAAAAPAAVVAPDAVAATGTAAPADGDAVAIKIKADAATAALAKKMGYNVTNKDGEPLYCRTDRITGTHIGTQTTCLTARQLYAQQEQMRRDMSSTMQNIPGATQR